MRRLLLELKIAGINFPLVTAALSLALVLFAALAGELLDVDAYTGGFNLQIAWATGWVAGQAVTEYLEKKDGAAQ